LPEFVFDLQTALVIGGITSAVIAASFGVLWLVTNRHPGLPWISAGYAVGAVSTLFVLGRIHQLLEPSLLSLLVINSGQVLASQCWTMGVAAVLGLRTRIPEGWILILGLSLLFIYTTTLENGFQLRLGLLSLSSAYYAIRTIGLAHGPLRSTLHPLLLLGVLLPFTLQGLYHGGRSLLLVWDWWQHSGQLIGPNLLALTQNSKDITGTLFNVMNTFAVAFATLTMVSERMNHQLQVLASHDSLTGVLNRRAFMEQLPRDRARARRQRHQLALLLIDIDHFKRINDSHGHLAGDAYLKTLVRELKTVLRQEDLLGRYGGEEFCAAVVVDDHTDAQNMAERLRTHVESLRVPFQGVVLQTTLSIGVTLLDPKAPPEDAIHQALQSADQAMYEAKHQGRNRVHYGQWAMA